jgi:hypothetical protein
LEAAESFKIPRQSNASIQSLAHASYQESSINCTDEVNNIEVGHSKIDAKHYRDFSICQPSHTLLTSMRKQKLGDNIYRESYIFWDIENCKLDPKDDVLSITSTIESIMGDRFQYDTSVSPFTKAVFLAHDIERAYKVKSNIYSSIL